MKKEITILAILISLMLILQIIKTYIGNDADILGLQLSDLQKEVDKYQNLNVDLRQQIYSQESLTNINTLAIQQGFIHGKIFYIK